MLHMADSQRLWNTVCSFRTGRFGTGRKVFVRVSLQQHAKHNNILYCSHHDNKINRASFSKTRINFKSQYQYFSLSHLTCVFETQMKSEKRLADKHCLLRSALPKAVLLSSRGMLWCVDGNELRQFQRTVMSSSRVPNCPLWRFRLYVPRNHPTGRDKAGHMNLQAV